ncbi:MAG: CPBP family glutamic-type intramembrane protease [Ruminiclostridium sp.]
MFGLVHLLNLAKSFSSADISVDTISQIFYAAFLGIFFAAIYFRTRNLWISVLFHSLFDIADGCLLG